MNRFPHEYVEIIEYHEPSPSSPRSQVMSQSPKSDSDKILSIRFINYERRYDKSKSKYYVYVIRVSQAHQETFVKFRYSVLRRFYENLLEAFPNVHFPSFPDKIYFGEFFSFSFFSFPLFFIFCIFVFLYFCIFFLLCCCWL